MYSKGAVYYDKLNETLQKDDIQFYKSIISDDINDVCEIACGTGRILYSLAKSGRNLTGIDISTEMLEIAMNKKKELGIDAKLICDDMCSLRKHGMFSVIICGYNSFQHICEEDNVYNFFYGIRDNLKKEGMFVLGVFNPNKRYLFANGNEQLLAKFVTSNNERITIIEHTRYQQERSINYIDYYYYKDDSFIFRESYKMRQYSPKELDEYIIKSGFYIVKKYGSYQKESFVNSSPKQIYLLKTAN